MNAKGTRAFRARRAAVLLAVFLAVQAAGVLCAGAESGPEAAISTGSPEPGLLQEESVVSAAEPEQSATDAAPEADDPDWQNGIPVEVLDEISSMDLEELKEYGMKLYELIQSDDFQEVIQHPEVRDLTVDFLGIAGDYLYREPEVAEKVLKVIGTGDRTVNIIMLLLLKGEDISEAFGKFRETSEGKEILDFIGKNFDRKELEDSVWKLVMGLSTAARNISDEQNPQ